MPGHPQLGPLWESVSLQPSSKGELHSENIGVVTDETELDTQRISQSCFFKELTEELRNSYSADEII